MDVEFVAHVGDEYDVFVGLGDGEYFEVGDSLDTEVLYHLYQLQLQVVHLQPVVFKSYYQVVRAVSEGCDALHLEHCVSHQQAVPSPPHHAVLVLVPRHPLNAAPTHLRFYLLVDLLGEIVFEELDAFEEGAVEGEDVGLGGGDVKIGLGDWGFGYGL